MPRKPVPKSGPKAIAAYLERIDSGRLIQSIKSLASDALFRHTQVAGHPYTFEDLVSFIVRELTAGLGNEAVGCVVVGRPVRFVGAKAPEDEGRAVDRLRRAFEQAGIAGVTFEYEPVAAAYFYESQLDHEELVLIADFGGGTSDFCLLRVGPEIRKRGHNQRDILGSEGVPVAGDSFDAAIIHHLVSPMLGRGTHYRSLGKLLPVPHSLYRKLERWHHLSFLKTRETLEMLRSIQVESEHPEMLGALIELVENDLGFHLHQAVQRTKAELSINKESSFKFQESDLRIERTVTRRDFDTWIGADLNRMEAGLDRLLKSTGALASEVDKVFLTGGTSLVPAVRGVFAKRFGASRLETGNEFSSVALGLALRAAEMDAAGGC